MVGVLVFVDVAMAIDCRVGACVAVSVLVIVAVLTLVAVETLVDAMVGELDLIDGDVVRSGIAVPVGRGVGIEATRLTTGSVM